jgi:hypothetical protein
MAMTKTTVYLTEDAKRRLHLAARRQRRTEADLIRVAIDVMLSSEPLHARPNPPALDLDPAVADHVDDYLSAGFGRDGLDGEW